MVRLGTASRLGPIRALTKDALQPTTTIIITTMRTVSGEEWPWKLPWSSGSTSILRRPLRSLCHLLLPLPEGDSRCRTREADSRTHEGEELGVQDVRGRTPEEDVETRVQTISIAIRGQDGTMPLQVEGAEAEHYEGYLLGLLLPLPPAGEPLNQTETATATKAWPKPSLTKPSEPGSDSRPPISPLPSVLITSHPRLRLILCLFTA